MITNIIIGIFILIFNFFLYLLNFLNSYPDKKLKIDKCISNGKIIDAPCY